MEAMRHGAAAVGLEGAGTSCYLPALARAARGGHETVVLLLLEYKEHAPRADSQDGLPLVDAAFFGHEALLRLLLEWREHASKS